jgi:hypothetical protein
MTPHPDRLSPSDPACARLLQLHRDAIAAGRSAYIDPRTGLLVMTARFLWERGYCCDSGCRHCPWIERPRPDAD